MRPPIRYPGLQKRLRLLLSKTKARRSQRQGWVVWVQFNISMWNVAVVSDVRLCTFEVP